MFACTFPSLRLLPTCTCPFFRCINTLSHSTLYESALCSLSVIFGRQTSRNCYKNPTRGAFCNSSSATPPSSLHPHHHFSLFLLAKSPIVRILSYPENMDSTPRFFIVRNPGPPGTVVQDTQPGKQSSIVPLIPVDILPPWVKIEGYPRGLSIEQTAGMTSLGGFR